MRSPARTLSIPLLASVLAALAPGAWARDRMTWLMPDVPPASMPVDGQPTDGIADQVVRHIVANWPEAEHHFIYANPKRTWLMIEKKEQACVVAALRTAERDRFTYFVTTSVAPPIQLIVRDGMENRLPLNAHGEADLRQVVHGTQLRGIIVDRRSYGPHVDHTIASRPATSRLETTAVGDYGKNVLKLVAHGRADYTIDYDYSLQYARQSEAGLDKLRTVPIAGNGKPMPAGIACPATIWGQAAARRIDQIVGTRAGAEAMLKAQNSWHTEATRQRYAAQLQEFQRQRARPGMLHEPKP